MNNNLSNSKSNYTVDSNYNINNSHSFSQKHASLDLEKHDALKRDAATTILHTVPFCARHRFWSYGGIHTPHILPRGSESICLELVCCHVQMSHHYFSDVSAACLTLLQGCFFCFFTWVCRLFSSIVNEMVASFLIGSFYLLILPAVTSSPQPRQLTYEILSGLPLPPAALPVL